MRAKRPGGGDRPRRVAEQLQHELGQLLVRGLKDPRLGGVFVTITGVKLSPDLREGVVYYSVFGDDAVRKSTAEGLAAAAGYLRHEVAQNLGLRVAPSFRFVFDESIERGARIEELLREVHAGEPKDPPPDPEKE
ncbi:MAG: 30S ribosome-binding factor RbfA [Deltaproteobacteria bacterium]